MKKLFTTLLVVAVAIATSACESDQEKQLRLERNHQIKLAKISSGQYAIETEQEHERSMARIHRPVSPGLYTDYRGNTEYGYWNNGSWAWNNPQSTYAVQSNHYVDYQVATGALVAGAILTRASWDRDNSSGWKKTNITVNNYTSKDGKTISKEAYNKSYNKNPVVKKPISPNTKTSAASKAAKSKWDSKRKVKPTYAKGGFRNNFDSNAKKSLAKKKAASSYSKPVKSTYSKTYKKKTTNKSAYKKRK